MRFLLSCPLAGRISGGFKKYYRLEVQLAYLVNFAQLLLRLCTVCFTFYFFCTPNQPYTPLSHFFQEYVSIYFLFGLVPLAGRILRLRKYYRLEIQLVYLVDFAQFVLPFAPQFTFLHSKLQSYTPWNHFILRIHFISFLLDLEPVYSQQDLRRLRKYHWLLVQLTYQSTSPNF